VEETIHSSAQVMASVDAETAWQKMRSYGDLDWAAGVEEVELVVDGLSQVRRVRLVGSEDWLDERIIAFDERQRTIHYGIEGESMGVLRNYEARAQILERMAGCIVRWQCQAEAKAGHQADAQALLDQMAKGMAGLFAAYVDGQGVEAADVRG
jgi:carbon monoxide dehydrogenase subunit G